MTFLVVSSNIAENIKSVADKKGITASKMLADCRLSKNLFSTMSTNGYFPRLDNLVKIAEYLDCSIDYLVNRTDNPNSHKQGVSIGGNFENSGGNVAIGAHNTINAAPADEQETALMNKYKALDPVQKAKLLIYADRLLNGK